MHGLYRNHVPKGAKERRPDAFPSPEDLTCMQRQTLLGVQDGIGEVVWCACRVETR